MSETAELVLLDLSISPESPNPGDQVTIIAQARNAGDVESGAFQARYRIERDDGGGAVQSDVYWPNLYAGESHSEQWQVSMPVQPGSYTYTVTLDVYNQVNEQNKNDNAGSQYFEIGAPVSMQLPDDGEEERLSGRNVNVKKEEEEVIESGNFVKLNIGAGNTPQAEINVQGERLREAIANYWANYANALDNFQTSMTFPPDQEVEADYLDAIVKSLFKTALGFGLGHLATELGEHGKDIVDAVKSMAEALIEESGKAKTPTGKVKIADYIEDLRDSINSQRQKMRGAINYHPLIDHYAQVTSDLPDKGTATANGWILGPGAQFIINLRASVQHFQESTPSQADFQQRLTEAFAGMPVKQGGHDALNGRLFFHLNLKNDGAKWEIGGKTDQRWTLYTSEPGPEGIAHSLQRSLAKAGKKPYESELPKEIEMFIEVEEPGNNTYADGRILFANDPDAYEVRTNYSASLFEKAWAESDIKRKVLEEREIVGKSL